ncbi:hypothetical protein ABTX99_31760 [Streptomyces flaveolus]
MVARELTLSARVQEGQATVRDVRETRALRTVASSAVINLTSPILSS